MPTLLGDTNLDGTVDLNDVATTTGNWGVATSGATWQQGDFYHTGAVDLNDVSTATGVWGQPGMVQLGYWPSSDQQGGQFGDKGVSAQLTVVPEPTTLALLAIGGAVGLAGGAIRRRRQGLGDSSPSQPKM